LRSCGSFRREQIQNAEQRSGNVVPHLVQAILVNSGRADVCAKAIDREHAKRKQNAPAKIRHIEHIANSRKNLSISVLSPALLQLRYLANFGANFRYRPASFLNFLARAFRKTMR